MFSSFTKFFTFAVVLVVGLSSRPGFSLTLDQSARVDKSAELHEIQQDDLLKTISWLEDLDKTSPKDISILVSLTRLKFYKAINDPDKKSRIIKYQEAMDMADQALAIDPNDPGANFWKAAAIGEKGLDTGISASLKSAHPMKDCLDMAIKQNEKIERGGPHRALGRLYFELPGWPLSFGDNKEALKHLERAKEIEPSFTGNRVFLGQVLLKLGRKDEAKVEIEYVLNKPVDPNHPAEQTKYLELAKKLHEKL